MTKEAFHRLPRTCAGYKMPTEHGIMVSDSNARKEAEIGSEQLRDAVRKLLGLRPWR